MPAAGARYAVTIRTGLGAAEAWARVLDPVRHADVVPLTTLTGRTRRGPLSIGERFTMRTALGPLRLDDEMVVDRLRTDTAGGAVRFVKTGRLLRGIVLARVGPAREAGDAVVRWDAELRVRGLPRALDPVVAVVASAAYGAALRRLLSPGAGRRPHRSRRTRPAP